MESLSLLTLMPSPGIMNFTLSVSADISVRIPPAFFLLMIISFGHLIHAESPVTFLIALAALTAESIVRKGACCGRTPGLRIKERYIPLPGGENHFLPSLPPPLVWLSAKIQAPSG